MKYILPSSLRILLVMFPLSIVLIPGQGGHRRLAKVGSPKFIQIMYSINNTGINQMEAILTRRHGGPRISACQGQPVTKLAENIFDDRKIAHLVNEPRVQLYSGTNYTGNVMEFDFALAANEVNCHNLRGFSNTKSVMTHGKCMRLFSYGECRGWSVVVYPGSGNSRKVRDGKLTRVSSIGTCLPHELQFDGKNNTFIKNTSDVKGHVRDHIDIFDYQKDNYCENYNKCPGSLGSLYCCTQGDSKRVEFLKANITGFTIDPLRPTKSPSNGSHSLQEMEEGDVRGYGIPPRYGGSVEAYNVFPQSQAGRKEWLRVLSEIPGFLNKSKLRRVEVAVNFQYENSGTSRPFAFYYHLRYLSEEEPKVFCIKVMN